MFKHVLWDMGGTLLDTYADVYLNDEKVLAADNMFRRWRTEVKRLLRPGGRLAVVSFHSTEDRIVKNFLRERSGGDAGGSRHRPALLPSARAATFHPPARKLRPGKAEEARNPRARSATLRSAVRTAAPAWPATMTKEAMSC